MGVDAIIYAEGNITDEQIAAMEPFIKNRVEIAHAWREGEGVIGWDKYSETPQVELRTWSRYYGPGYERGSWPLLFTAIMAMSAAFPGAKVYYGGDCDDIRDECTGEFLKSMWAHFFSAEGDAYHERWREWSKDLNRKEVAS